MKSNAFILLLLFINSFDLIGQGIPYGQEFQVNTYTPGYQHNPTATGLSDGGFVISWIGDHQYKSGICVIGQLFDPLGNKKGDQFKINTYRSYMDSPTIAAFSNGGFVVCWESYNQDGSKEGCFGQLFNSLGIKKGDEFQINTYTQFS